MDAPIFPAWSLEKEEAMRTLETTDRGLSEDDARMRAKHFGLNVLPKKKRFSAIGIFARQFASPLIFLLLAAALLTLYLREWIDVGVIVLAIAVNALLGFYQEFRAETALENLTTYVRDRARVRRGGIEAEIDSAHLTPGDVIHVGYGARVPADARLIEAVNLAVDESILTGESLPVQKTIAAVSEAASVTDRTNMIHAGTLIVEGDAIAVVAAIGASTEIGHVAELVSDTEDAKTPLQAAIARFAWWMFLSILVLVALIFAIGVSRGESILPMLLMAAAISVGAVPEALPIALTVILALGVERLARRKGVMRNLAAAETLGSASVIMTDKTGTLTEANMRLVEIVTRKELRGAPMGGFVEDEDDLLRSALWGADATIENPRDDRSKWRFLGRPFETGMFRAANERGIDVSPYIMGRPSPLLAFNSTNKFSIVEGKGVQYVIGAPDILLRRSDLSKDDFMAFEARVQTISVHGKRLLGVGRIPSHAKKAAPKESDARDLEFLGLLVFEDPLRPDAADAVQRMERLGARTVMLTGDLKGTALSIAHELGWDVSEGEVLTGEELRQLSDAELFSSIDRIKIFSRVTPEDKLRVARCLRARGEVTAMTGDGVNDAPALKLADIGIALGSGSDVAKSVADLVILDDHFKTIVAAIEEGRRILENIRKVMVYLVSNCLDEVFLIGGALLMGLPLPLSALQIIWVNFFTDSLPALSYAFDTHVPAHRSGRGISSIFNAEVKILTFGIGSLSSVLLFVLYWYLLRNGTDVAYAQSTIFLCFSLYVLFVSFSLSHLRLPFYFYSPLKNPYLFWSVALGVALTVATVTVPFLKNIFGLMTPPLHLWLVVAVWLAFNIALVEAAKWASIRFAR